MGLLAVFVTQFDHAPSMRLGQVLRRRDELARNPIREQDLVFGSGTAAQTAAVADPGEFAQSGRWIPVAIGVVIALIVHLVKSAVRPAANVATAGVAAPVLSTVEDVTSIGLVVVALLIPALVLVFVLTLALAAWAVLRRRRRRREDLSDPAG